MRFLLTVGAMIGLALPQASTAQEEVLSKELKKLSERDAERQARRDLDALLTDFSGYHVGKRFLFQDDVWFWTEPRSSKTEGICERDLLQIFYQPANPRSRDDENFTVRARNIEATRYYGFSELPSGSTLEAMGEGDTTPSVHADRKCRAKLKDEWIGWFKTESPEVAVQGYLALIAARDALDAGLVEISGCEDTPEAIGTRCRTLFDRAVQDGIFSSITRTDSSDTLAEFTIDAGVLITLQMDSPALQFAAANIKSIKVQTYITS